MRKYFALLLLVAISCAATGQKIKHNAYITYYNRQLKGPDSVSWILSPNMVSCIKPDRVDAFAEDPEVSNGPRSSDYTNTHFERGHLFPWDDAACSQLNITECFYMTNMLPQRPPFNKGDWKTLENQERRWAKTATIRLVAGGLGTKGRLPSGENIPAFMWKAIYHDHHWYGWVMPNEDTSHGHPYNYWMYPDFEKFCRDVHFKIRTALSN